MSEKVKIGKIIKQRRNELKFTLDELSSKASISKSFLWEIEQDNIDVGFSKICRIFEALDMDLELCKRSSRPQKPCDCHTITFKKGKLKL